MGFFYGMFIVIAWLVIALFLRLLTTTLHEMGHALPALVLTDRPVSVYIGSYGDETNSHRFSFGRLRFFFKPKFFDWNLGMCRHEGGKLSNGKLALIVIGGPIASVIVGSVALWALIAYRANEVIFIIAAAFLLSAFWDFFVNLLPSSFGTSGIHGGTGMMSDGALLMLLWQRSRLPASYLKLEKLYEAKDYQAVVDQLEQDIEDNAAPASAYFLGIEAYKAMKEYGGALSIYEAYQKRFPLQNSDYLVIGNLYDQFGNYREAINCYAEYLHYYYGDLDALYAKGHAYQELGEHDRAITDFNVVLAQSPGHISARLGRVRSLLRLNENDYASGDLAVLARLAPEHPRYHLYLGFYQEAVGDYHAAHASITKAQALGDDFHGIAFKLNELEGLML
ncbi:MAG: M50 family metallopeptidase [Bacteroidota bacterium]